ncbi:MAG: phosphodiester glycosidase family protein [Verrucomicrobia bacterium]|nr:phosphodiester glycosidase family protein [Verrucomicrobiota bacterium]
MALILAVLATGAPWSRAEIKVGAWTPIFQGVEWATGEADAKEVRLQKVNAVRVDLRDPDVEFFSTPSNGDRPLETTSETTSEFAEHYGVQVAINANFFAPCCAPGDKDLSGLAISRGEVVSPQVAYNSGSKVLLITRDNRASIVSTEKPVSTEGVWTAVAGSDIVLNAGAKPQWVPRDFILTAHPRTAVGVSKDGRYLLMLTIDGRQASYSAGATLGDVADWLRRFGAYHGLNLDGGGSTAMVKLEAGKAVVLNRPSGVGLGSSDNAGKSGGARKQRSNGNNFGVFAKPLAGATAAPKPE